MSAKLEKATEAKGIETKDDSSIGLRGDCLSDDLECIRSLNSKSDTADSILPDLSLTDEDHKSLMKDASGPIYTDAGDGPEPMDFLKWQYNHWLLNNDRGLDCDISDIPEKGPGPKDVEPDSRDSDPEPKKDDPGVKSDSRPEKPEASESEKAADKIYLDHDVELDADKDGIVKKLTYTDHNGKKITISEDQWKNVKGSKTFPNGILVARDGRGETTILLPNGKVVHLNASGRFKLFTDTTDM